MTSAVFPDRAIMASSGVPVINYAATRPIASAPVVYAAPQAAVPGGMSLFDSIDRNHDGVITRAEFDKAMLAAPRTAPSIVSGASAQGPAGTQSFVSYAVRA